MGWRGQFLSLGLRDDDDEKMLPTQCGTRSRFQNAQMLTEEHDITSATKKHRFFLDVRQGECKAINEPVVIEIMVIEYGHLLTYYEILNQQVKRVETTRFTGKSMLDIDDPNMRLEICFILN